MMVQNMSLYAQTDSIKFTISNANDKFYIVAADLGAKIGVYAFKIETNDKAEIDSLNKGLVPFRIVKMFNIETILKNNKEAELKKVADLKKLTNTPVPDFNAVDTLGLLHRPRNYLGRVLVLHFWNFWDASFEHEIPILNKIYEKHQKEGLQILSFIDLELTPNEKERLVRMPILFPMISNSRNFSWQFINVSHAMPYLIVVDKQGLMRYFYINNELQDRNSHFYKKDDKSQKELDFEETIQLLLNGM